MGPNAPGGNWQTSVLWCLKNIYTFFTSVALTPMTLFFRHGLLVYNMCMGRLEKSTGDRYVINTDPQMQVELPVIFDCKQRHNIQIYVYPRTLVFAAHDSKNVLNSFGTSRTFTKGKTVKELAGDEKCELEQELRKVFLH